jgi:hypothetical protein
MEAVHAEDRSSIRDLAVGTAVGAGVPTVVAYTPAGALVTLALVLVFFVVGMYLMERSQGPRSLGKGLVWGSGGFAVVVGFWLLAWVMVNGS